MTTFQVRVTEWKYRKIAEIAEIEDLKAAALEKWLCSLPVDNQKQTTLGELNEDQNYTSS